MAYVKVTPKKTNQAPIQRETGGSKVFQLVFLVILLTIVSGMFYLNFDAFKQIFFTENPFFNIKEYEVVIKGELTEEKHVRELVDNYLKKQVKNKEEQLNLFNLNKEELSRSLSKLPSVLRAEITSLYPDSFRIKLHDHIPYAYLQKRSSGLMITDKAICIPAPQRDVITAPVIVGITGAQKLKLGTTLKDERITNAINTLKLIQTGKKGIYFEPIKRIYVNNPREIKLVIGGRGYVAEGCTVILNSKQLERSLSMAAEIIKKANMTQSPIRNYINASSPDSMNAPTK